MKRFTVVENGYDVNEVNKFIDVVIKRLELMNNEVKKYQKEVDDLNRVIDQKNYEDSQVSRALIAIQETSDRINKVAKQEADLVLEEARNNANSIIHEAIVNASNKEKEVIMLQKNMTIYKARVRSLLEAQLKIIDDVDKIEL